MIEWKDGLTKSTPRFFFVIQKKKKVKRKKNEQMNAVNPSSAYDKQSSTIFAFNAKPFFNILYNLFATKMTRIYCAAVKSYCL